MVDILPYVAEILKETGAQVELAENDFSGSLPLITMLEVSNISAVITEASEQVSDISIQLDIYANSPEEAQTLAGVVSSLLIAHGFRRDAGQLMKEDNMWRRMEQYGCYVDSQNRIYSGSDLLI